ncbi:hypothetical protein G3N57_05365 [Paraburkholderia sp. Se-20369]|nr:hypothetical protein [Paraburkholderia sp. Se-20369]
MAVVIAALLEIKAGRDRRRAPIRLRAVELNADPVCGTARDVDQRMRRARLIVGDRDVSIGKSGMSRQHGGRYVQALRVAFGRVADEARRGVAGRCGEYQIGLVCGMSKMASRAKDFGVPEKAGEGLVFAFRGR